MDLTTTSTTSPTVEETNALPDKVRQYIHDLETRTITEGKALAILELANERDALLRRVEELEREVALTGESKTWRLRLHWSRTLN